MVEIFVRCQNLTHPSNKSISPYCKISICHRDNIWHFIHQTQKISRQHNPLWFSSHIRRRPCTYMKFQVFSKQVMLGEVTINYQELIQQLELLKELKNYLNQTAGIIQIKGTPIQGEKSLINLKLSAQNLPSKDLFGQSDPYLKIYRTLDDNTQLLVKTTETVSNNQNPVWEQFQISFQVLANGDLEKPIKIECYDWDRVGNHDFIGELKLTLNQLVVAGNSYNFYDYKKNAPGGKLIIQQARIEKLYSMQDYLENGTLLRFVVGIDFTFSNKEYTNPESLHYLNENIRNSYLQAIQTVMDAMKTLPSQEKLIVYGFGGQPEWLPQVSHCFALNQNQENPQISSFDQLLQVYHQALPKIQLAQPTHFDCLLKQTINLAVQSQQAGGSNYYVLMILTDGDIHDMPETISSLVKASHLPISLLIVGIGKEDFVSMVTLDADNGFLEDDTGNKAVRDLVQFIKYDDVSDVQGKIKALALEELETQFISYMRNESKVPGVQQCKEIRVQQLFFK